MNKLLVSEYLSLAEKYLFCSSPDLFIRENFPDVINQKSNSDTEMSIREYSNDDGVKFLLFFSKEYFVYALADPFKLIDFHKYCEAKTDSGTSSETYIHGAQYLVAEHILFRIISSLDNTEIWGLLPSIISLLKLANHHPRDFAIKINETYCDDDLEYLTFIQPNHFFNSNYCLVTHKPLMNRGFFAAEDRGEMLNELKKRFRRSILAEQLEAEYKYNLDGHYAKIKNISTIPQNQRIKDLVKSISDFCLKCTVTNSSICRNTASHTGLPSSLKSYLKKNLEELTSILDKDYSPGYPESLKKQIVMVSQYKERVDVYIDLNLLYIKIQANNINIDWITLVFHEKRIKEFIQEIFKSNTNVSVKG